MFLEYRNSMKQLFGDRSVTHFLKYAWNPFSTFLREGGTLNHLKLEDIVPYI